MFSETSVKVTLSQAFAVVLSTHTELEAHRGLFFGSSAHVETHIVAGRYFPTDNSIFYDTAITPNAKSLVVQI